jgi:hypothetical protein
MLHPFALTKEMNKADDVFGSTSKKQPAPSLLRTGFENGTVLRVGWAEPARRTTAGGTPVGCERERKSVDSSLTCRTGRGDM